MEILEPQPMAFLSFIEYQIIDSNTSGNILTRTIKVTVQNTSDNLLSNISLTVDSYPNFATFSNTELYIDYMSPNQTITTVDTITFSVDQSQLTEDGLRLIWQVECDSDGDHLFKRNRCH